jgi:hypothetical protein
MKGRHAVIGIGVGFETAARERLQIDVFKRCVDYLFGVLDVASSDRCTPALWRQA